MRESFEAALSGELPDSRAAATAINLELTAENRRPAALAGPGVKILGHKGKWVAVEGLRAADWRALIQDDLVATVELHSINVVKERAVIGFISSEPPRVRNNLQDLWGVNGEGMSVAVIDAGAVDGGHSEFRVGGTATSRVVLHTNDVHMHATQMGSIIGARGGSQPATGVAPSVRIHSYFYGLRGYTPIIDAMSHAVSTANAAVSSHSYGPLVGWESEPAGWHGTEKFGRYDAEHSAMDWFLSSHPEHNAFAAAGNERGERGPACPADPSGDCCPHQEFQGAISQPSTTCRPKDGGESGADTLKGACIAKNTICVTNVERTGTEAWLTPDNTGMGPTDDFRIKPDLAAEGFHVNVATGVSNGQSSWGFSSGTSSATALASGIGVLLVQHYRNEHNGRMPLAAEIKAALIHTARGPRPTLLKGWGVINASGAARVIDGRDGYHALTTTYHEPVTINLVPTSGRIIITLVWTDPEAPPRAPVSLKNDIDMLLVGPAGNKVLPWVFNGTNFIRGDNHRDNVEVIEAPPAAGGGIWRLHLSGRTISGSQVCALVFSGLRPSN